MKKLLIMLFLLLPLTAQAVDWSDDIAVGLNGASFLSGTPAAGYPFNESSLPYWDFGMVFQKVAPYRVLNVAQAGSTAFDGLPGPEFLGTVSQHNRLMSQGMWVLNGKNYVNYEVVDGTNSCMHYNGTFSHEPCTHEEMELVFDQIETVVADNAARGITTILTGWPNYEDIDPALVLATYGLPWFISKPDFDYFISRYEARVAQMKAAYGDVIIRHPWRGMKHIGDGLHPDKASQYSAAFDVFCAILFKR